jgi:hypothetical protein
MIFALTEAVACHVAVQNALAEFMAQLKRRAARRRRAEQQAAIAEAGHMLSSDSLHADCNLSETSSLPSLQLFRKPCPILEQERYEQVLLLLMCTCRAQI